MASVVIVHEPEEVRIPAGLDDLDSFRAWALSDAFPESGRIDYLAGEVHVDMSPEDLLTHGSPKAAILSGLYRIVVDERDAGLVLCDRSRVSSPAADLSAEPDVLVVLDESLRVGRVRLVPKAGGAEGRYVEIEGPPDVVVECVSDSSVGKDTKTLRDLYYRAGVTEYWVVDVRTTALRFDIHQRGPAGFAPATAGEDGFRRSVVLGLDFRLTRRPRPSGLDAYRLEERVPR